MANFESLIIHLGFGTIILIGLISAEFTPGQSLLGILLGGTASTLSAICSCASQADEPAQFNRKRLNRLLSFLIIWTDILTNLVASATCARVASATIDYISKGRFREFLFGLEELSLGEPWPDVLGVSIILVVSVLFMMGLERSYTVMLVLGVTLVSHFIFLATTGILYSVNDFQDFLGSLKIRPPIKIFKAASLCFFAFVHKMPLTSKRDCLRILKTLFIPLVLYMALVVGYTSLTCYKELNETAIPLVQVFEKRQHNLTKLTMAVFTIGAVCLSLTELMPRVFHAFVQLASKDWKIFVGTLQYQSRTSGAPILAIFVAGSLTAILTFACPLSRLINLLNVSCLTKCVLTSAQLIHIRYKPELRFNDLDVATNSDISYTKLTRPKAAGKTPAKQKRCSLFAERLKRFFCKTPQYIHKLSSPKIRTRKIRKMCQSTGEDGVEEQECLLFQAAAGQPVSIDVPADSGSENEENEMEVMTRNDEETSDGSTDIDVIVDEYKEELKVKMADKFENVRAADHDSSAIVVLGILLIIIVSANVSFWMNQSNDLQWLNFLGITFLTLIIAVQPTNSNERTKPCLLPSWSFLPVHVASIVLNIVLSGTIVNTVWEALVFWLLAGLIPYFGCDCCGCDVLEPLMAKTTAKIEPHQVIYEYKDTDNIIVAR